MRSAPRPPTAAAALLAVALAGGCAGMDAAEFRPGTMTCEGGPCSAGRDGGGILDVPDAGTGGNSEPIWANGTGEAPAGRFEADSATGIGSGDPSACFDGADNDGDGFFDCSDETCRTVGSCVVGSGDFCEEAGTRTLDFTGCDTLTVADCLGGGEPVTEFGPVRWIADGGLHTGGDDGTDGGLVLGDALDPTTTRIQLEVALGDADGCAGPCLESAGVALTAPQDVSGTVNVRPLVGLLLSGGRHEISLIVANEVVRTFPAAGTVERWRLIARPTGLVTFERVDDEAATRTEIAWAPARDARIALFGRNDNRPAGAGGGARIRSLAITTGSCDIPDAWSARSPVTLWQRGLGATYDTGTVTGISVVDAAGTLRVAFEDGNLIFFGGRGGGGADELVLAHDEGTPALEPAAGTWRDHVRDPELFVDADGRLRLLFTGVDAEGKRSIGLAIRRMDTMAADGHVFDPEPDPVIASWAYPDADGWEMPTVARVPGGPLVMIARARSNGGGHSLVPFWSEDDGATWERFLGSELDGMTARGVGSAGSRFDADEIAHPSLIVHGGAFQLHYAGRRGTRWGVGLLASDSLIQWRDVSDGRPVLGRGADDFDRLGPREADAVVGGGELELFYVGTDGARGRFGRAVRRTLGTGSP